MGRRLEVCEVLLKSGVGVFEAVDSGGGDVSSCDGGRIGNGFGDEILVGNAIESCWITTMCDEW